MSENHVVIITRSKLYPSFPRAGAAWQWTYDYTVDGGPICQFGPGLASLRELVRRKWGVKGTETWKLPKT